MPESEPEVPESAGEIVSPIRDTAFHPESQGAFRAQSRITVRHVEIARKLAVSETLNPLEQMRMRLEAIFLLSTETETRRRAKITDAEMAKAREIYRLVLSFMNAQEHFLSGHLSLTFPFPQRAERELELAFSEWLEPQIRDDLLLGEGLGERNQNNWMHLTPETYARLKTRFEAEAGLWVLILSGKVADCLNLNEFSEAVGSSGILTPLRRMT
jgi:hypothetical protein